MNRLDIKEWYDGDIQVILEQDGRYFYALCVSSDFFSQENDRRFLVIPIHTEDRIALFEAFNSGDLVIVNDTLVSILEGRKAGLAQGDVEDWNMTTISFDVDTSAYRNFLRFPLIDYLANPLDAP